MGPEGLTTGGTSYFVDPVNGSNGNTGLTMDQPLKTVEVAYSLCVNNNNDVVYLMASGTSAEGTSGGTANALTATLTWSKNFTHLVGLCSPTVFSQRARITQAAATTGLTAMVTVSGSGCIMRNVMFFQGVADATSLVAVKVTGQRNVFENVHFAGVGDATMSAAGAASLKIDGGAENVFRHCTIGLDTIARDADATEILFDTAATRNVFEDCFINSYISAAGFASVTIADSTGIDRVQVFKNCTFFTKSTNKATAQTSVFSIPAISQGAILLINSFAGTDGGAAEWDSNNRAIIWNNSVAAAASAAGGILTAQ